MAVTWINDDEVTLCDGCSEPKPTQLIIDEDRGVGYLSELELCDDCQRRRRQS